MEDGGKSAEWVVKLRFKLKKNMFFICEARKRYIFKIPV